MINKLWYAAVRLLAVACNIWLTKLTQPYVIND